MSVSPATAVSAAGEREEPWPTLVGPTVSVIICAYTMDRLADTVAAVASVKRQSPPPFEIVVVVDHNPRLHDALAGALPADVRLVANGAEPGLSAARNSGLSAVTGDLVMFLDDDALLTPGSLAILAQRCCEKGVIGTGSRIDPIWQSGAPRWFPGAFLWTVGCTYEGLAPGPVRNLIGASMMVRRDAFLRVGGFVSGIGRTRANLPLGCEETEFCIRAGRYGTGGVFIYEPAASALHLVGASRATWSYLARRCYAEGLSKFAVSRLAGRDSALSSEPPTSCKP